MSTKIANIGMTIKNPGYNSIIMIIAFLLFLYFMYNVVGFFYSIKNEETRCDNFLWSGLFGYDGVFEQCTRKYFDEYISRNDLFGTTINDGGKTTQVDSNAMKELSEAVDKTKDLEQETRANYGTAQQNIMNALSSLLVQTKIQNESVNAVKALDGGSLSKIIKSHRDIPRTVE